MRFSCPASIRQVREVYHSTAVRALVVRVSRTFDKSERRSVKVVRSSGLVRKSAGQACSKDFETFAELLVMLRLVAA
eukprot:6457319-Amphidinium_carterae.1